MSVSLMPLKKENSPLNILKMYRMPLDFDGVIIAAVGERKDMSGEAASRACIELPKDQEEILKALAGAGKTVVAVLLNGRPLAMPWTAPKYPGNP